MSKKTIAHRWVWSVSYRRIKDKGKSVITEEFYVSPTLALVLEQVQMDLFDESIEIECIKRHVPVLAVLAEGD